MAKQLNGDYPLGRMRNCFLKRELYTKRIAIARLDPDSVISHTEYEGIEGVRIASDSISVEAILLWAGLLNAVTRPQICVHVCSSEAQKQLVQCLRDGSSLGYNQLGESGPAQTYDLAAGPPYAGVWILTDWITPRRFSGPGDAEQRS